MRVILSGGGTGGHVYPAIAVAHCIAERLPKADILFVGAEGKMEMEKVPAAGFRIEGLKVSGLQRRHLLRNVSFPFKLAGSLMKARSVLRKFRPDVVAGFGGYASGPVLYMASLAGIPTVIQEQNSFPGITNKLLASRASTICVAYEGMSKFFPVEKLRLTGNPVRNDLRDVHGKRSEAIAHYGLDNNKKTLLLFGGSLGARTLNEAMRSAYQLLRDKNDTQVLWQMGRLYKEEFEQSPTARLEHVHAMEFIERMDLAYAAADVVICRAGALTISELTLTGKPAVLVPSPNVAEDHQTKNAENLVARDAALMVPDAQANEVLITTLGLLGDPEQLQRISDNARTLARPDATDRIVDEILNAAGQ